VHPLVFQNGPLALHWYGVMVALGFMVGLWTASRRGLRAGVPAERVLDLGPWLILGAILGARTLYVATFWRDQFAGKPVWEIVAVWRGGLVYYGGLAGASLAVVLHARRHQLPLWKLADILAPSIALGHAFGRIGCLLNGCCFGRECGWFWAIRYPSGHESHPVGAAATLVHPTQIYEALLNLGLFAGLVWWHGRKRFQGQVFALYLVGYGLLRSIVEMYRGDYPPDQLFLGGRLTPAHLVSAVILGMGLVLLRVLPRLDGRRG
jgi:phosphatidylglycerol:prolipoprotein diacylglycerol transferase